MPSDRLREQRYWIALNLIPNLTSRKIQMLLGQFSSPGEIWRASPQRFARIHAFSRSAETFVRHRQRLNEERGVERELEEIRRRGLRVLTLADPDYPRPLRAIANPPPVLYVQGDYIEKDELAIAVVGTRNPSSYGLMIAEKLSQELAEIGFTIVSGLARGVDAAAHRGALRASGRTLAVLGGGFAHLYPRENRSLATEIAECGGVMSEFPIRALPDRWTFPRRNRVISGLARGTLIVEAPQKSGALITARCALEQNREVFAVPGPITRRSHDGPHRLIQQGAKLVADIDDVLAEFSDLQETLSVGGKSRRRERERPRLTTLEARVLDVLEFEPTHFNDVVERAEITTSEASFALFQLMGKDLVKELNGKRYAKLP